MNLCLFKMRDNFTLLILPSLIMLRTQFNICGIHKNSVLMHFTEDKQETMIILGIGVLTLSMSF